MFDALIDDSDLPLARKSVIPGTGFFLPDAIEEDLEAQATSAALADAEVAVVADTDADGLACVALVREAYDDVLVEPDVGVDPDLDEPSADDGSADDDPAEGELADGASASTAPATGADAITDAEGLEELPTPDPHHVAAIPSGPHDLPATLERVAAHADPGLDVYVCDLCPDSYEAIEAGLTALVEVATAVRWYDHHQWTDAVADAVRECGVELVVGDGDRECTADVALRSIDHDFGERFADLAAATRDHDLWIREDPRSDDLADFAYWSDPETYVETIRGHGADLPATAERFLEERRVEKRALIEQAVGRAELREVGPWTVGVTYGRCSQNEVAEALREQGADASVIVKPAGSASIRGTDAFQRCHEVARQVNGGGHPKAAGCKPDIYHDMLDYAYHWTTRGAVAKQVILDAFRALETVERDERSGEVEESSGEAEESSTEVTE